MAYLNPTVGAAREAGLVGGINPDILSVYNATGGTLAEGTLVYLSGYDATSGLPKVVKADADAGGSPAEYIVRTAISNSTSGSVYRLHTLTGQNTNSANAVGDPVYLSTTPGGWTLTAPTAANATVQKVGVVTAKSATVGSIQFNLTTPGSKIGTNELQSPRWGVISETVLKSAFTDGGGASGTYAMATQIPAGAIYMYSTVTVNVAFSGDTSAVLTIGDGSDVDRYNTGTPSIFTTGAKEMGPPSGNRFHAAAQTVTLTVTSGADFTNVAGTGSITVSHYYLHTA